MSQSIITRMVTSNIASSVPIGSANALIDIRAAYTAISAATSIASSSPIASSILATSPSESTAIVSGATGAKTATHAVR